MSDYQAIVRPNLGQGTEAAYLADEVNHVQWMRMADFRDEEPHEADCETCSEVHGWRRVYVRA